MPLPAHLPVPVKGVAAESLMDSWGAARSQGRRHEGIDIGAKRGTPVLSTTPGLIVDTADRGAGGKQVWVIGPGLSYHYYAHLDRIASLSRGDWVRPGTVLGRVGSTGNAPASFPHLHYGIYLQGKGKGPVNPFPYLKP